VLASAETVHLARRIDGLEYLEHGHVSVKGLRDPVRVVRVVPTAGDPATRLLELGEDARDARSWRRYRGRAAGAAAVLLIAAVVGALALARARADPAPVVVPPDSLAVVERDAERVVAAVPVGGRPGDVVIANGSAWVANVSDSTVTRVDLETRRAVQTIGLGFEPTGMAAGKDAVWVVGGFDRRLSRIDAADGRIRLSVTFDERVGSLPEGYETGAAGVAVGEGGVWVSHGVELTLFDPRTGEVERTVPGGGPWESRIAVGEGAIWVPATNRHRLPETQSDWKTFLEVVDSEGRERRARIPLPSLVDDIEVRDGFVWVALGTSDAVWRIRPEPLQVDATIPSGDEPVGIAVDSWIWVANQTDAVVTRLDGRTGEQLSTIPVGGTLAGIASTGDELWVSVRP
jgi:streptogramin lyase